MQNLIPLIKKIAQRITETESKRIKLAEFVKEVSPGMDLTVKVSLDPLDSLKIVGVDGGIVKKSFHGNDCMLVRAAAACFHYEKGKVSKVEYFPSKNPPPKPEIYEALSELDWNHFTSLNRLKEEITVAIQAMEAFKPDLLLLDGLLLPHYLDKPANTSPLYNTYNNVLTLYRTLFSNAVKSRTALAGVVEDSRSVLFCTHLATNILSKVDHPMIPELKILLDKTRDSNILYFILKKGERSLSFTVPNPLNINVDFPPIQTFYLKTVEYDRPLKIDFLTETIRPDTLAGILLSISGYHSGYGIPAPLIEADQVAKLDEVEMDNFYANILSLTGTLPSIMRMRREQRPF